MIIENLSNKSHSTRGNEYNKYLRDHINNVNRAYVDHLRGYVISSGLLDSYNMNRFETELSKHDRSKYETIEYVPYTDHFYPENSSDKNYKNDYDLAWLHHQKVNPHHWQYWVLIKDDPGDQYLPLEMSTPAVLEMLCDWSSFQYIKEGSTANKWYKDNSKNMILHKNTRKLIEEILEECPDL